MLTDVPPEAEDAVAHCIPMRGRPSPYARVADEVSPDHSLGSEARKGYDGLIAVAPDLDAIFARTPRTAEG